MKRSFLSFSDLKSEELETIFSRMKDIKTKIRLRENINTLDGKVIGLLFEKPSTRTSAGFEVASLRLGAHPLYFPSNELQSSRGEPIKDTARVLGQDLDGIVARVYSHKTLDELKSFSNIPVINGLSDLEHPTQVISDLFTILETKGVLKGLKLAFIGDGNNVCNSLLLGAAEVGMHMTAACPEEYRPNSEILKLADEIATKSGSKLEIVEKPQDAAKDADLVYTDVWVSMGEERDTKRRMEVFKEYQINSQIMKLAKRDVLVMHCLPAHRGLEITDEIIEGDHSIVWRQSENKLYGAAVILEYFLGTSVILKVANIARQS